ncbi:cytochrome p450 domain-containing protein [Ditylenchus destructor]|uniref:Cytochrome p450 domain-containing protein n=1 Tax=Ditylenchus destructor TaxID=166010 RepID=A0AAD4R103_9BILA|nr:cytochrome p450 domain-containing protein [Ditylenchus destructor]
MALIFLVLFLCLPTIILFYNYYWKRRHLPPGPTPIPLLGNALSLANAVDAHKTFGKWAEQYGPVFTFWIAEDPVVAVTKFDLIKESFIKDADAYAGRHFFKEIFPMFTGLKGLHGVIRTEGDEWRTLRRFSLQVLRNLGMGRNKLETGILDHLTSFFHELREQIDVGISEHNLFPKIDELTGSTVNQLIFGFGFDKENVHIFHEQKRMLAQIQRESVTAGGLLSAKGRGDDQYFSMEPLRHMCFDLFAAGEDTTSFTLEFLVLYMILHQDVQKKMQDELDHAFGDTYDGPITSAQRLKLPYTNAVINETQRHCDLVPVNLNHTTTRDVVLNGYRLPKGTIVAPELCTVLYDENIFPEPGVFRPERFLNEKGQLKKCEELIPFSVGKRQCMGESLARTELFLFTANFFYNFKVSPVDPSNPPKFRKIAGISVKPAAYSCRIERRRE